MALYSASIDDNDPTVIYSSGWVLITSDPPWTGTMHSTSIPGSYARFRFTGSRVAIICTIPTGDGTARTIATVSIDNGAAIPVSHTTTGPVQYQVVLWDSGPLPFASHLVTLTDTGMEAYLRLDRIDYDPTANNAPSKSSDSLPTTTTVLTTTLQQPGSPQVSSSSVPHVSLTPSSSGVSTSVQTVYLSPTVSGSSTLLPPSDASGLSATSNTPARTIPRAALVGGVLGALLFILLLGVLLIFLRRQRKRANSQTIFSPFEISAHRQQRGSDTEPTPFQMPYSGSGSSRASNSIPMTDRKDTEFFDGIYDASHTISSSMSPNSLPSPAPFPHSHNYTPTSASTMQSTSLDLGRTDVHTGSFRGTMPSGDRATLFSADNRRTVTSYLTEAPPPAYGDVL